MSEYKRLTNNNADEYDPEYDFCIGCKYFGEPNGCNRPNGTCSNYERFIETYNRLAELEDKIENGTLVELPCKVGDRVYQTDGIRIYESTIKNIIYDTDGGIAFDDRAIGNSVFLTCEEAGDKSKRWRKNEKRLDRQL